MTIASPFIAVDNCKEELDYYRGVLGGEIHVFRRQGDKVLNAELNFGGTKITIADTAAAKPIAKGDYVKVMLKVDTEEDMRRIYKELATGGRIDAELYEAPFNGLLAIVTDRNGVGWVLQYVRS